MEINKLFISAIMGKSPEVTEGHVKVFTDGWDFIVYVVDDLEAFRVPRRDDYARKLPAEVAFLKEFSILSPVSVPRLSLNYLPDGTPFATYKFIAGVPFSPELRGKFSENEMMVIARQMGEFLSILHSFPNQKARGFGIVEKDVYRSSCEKMEKVKKTVYPFLSEYERKWMENKFNGFLQIIKQQSPEKRLIHSDILPEHMIVDLETHRLNGIIDFGDLEIADPALDFVFFARYGRKFLETAYDCYSLPQDDYFEERRKFYEDYLFIADLEHAIEKQEMKRIKLYKCQLSNRIGKMGE